MTLVQIDLRRDRARATAGTDAAEGDHAARAAGSGPGGAVSSDSPDRAHAAACVGLVLGGGLVLLAPLATLALTSRTALVVLLAGLAALGLIAALGRPDLEGDPS